VEAARALGAYYTPDALAEPLCRWAIRRPGDRVLDPSCGEGAFLVRAVDRLRELGAAPRALVDQVAGVELEGRALSRTRGALLSRHPGLRWGRLAEGDFFRFADRHLGTLSFDAVIGNPPYLRTQGRSRDAKVLALAMARRAGAELTADASAWAPFVAAAAGLVRPGGRLAMVVPREALFVNYARPLLAMLRRRFASVELEPLEGDWFRGALVKVAVLRAEGKGTGAAGGDRPSWVWSRIPEDCREACARALASPDLVPLTELGTLSIGIVTGENGFFLAPPGRRLPERYLLPAVSKPSQLEGATLDRAPQRLLALPPDYAGGMGALDRYLAEGEARGIDRNYKCRTRKPWYSVRRVLEPADLFLGYLVKRRPRIAANAARAWSTNNVHRIFLKDEWKPLAPGLAAAAYNAATMLSIELLGRVSAAGALKIEPGDAGRILLARPGDGAEIDRALREGRDGDAFRLADRPLGPDGALVRRAAEALRDARLATRPPSRASSRAAAPLP
jgi:tRNA1(Val) A37 N6-methylase TrmN6